MKGRYPKKRRRRIVGSSSDASDDENEGPDAAYRPPAIRKEKLQKKVKRQVMKIHGLSVTPEGKWLFAVSFSKAKTFHYLTHAQMKELYPMYLIGFYERHLKLGDIVDQQEEKKTLKLKLTLKHDNNEQIEQATESSDLNNTNS